MGLGLAESWCTWAGLGVGLGVGLGLGLGLGLGWIGLGLGLGFGFGFGFGLGLLIHRVAGGLVLYVMRQDTVQRLHLG